MAKRKAEQIVEAPVAAPAAEGNVGLLKYNHVAERWEVLFRGAVICGRYGSEGDEGAKAYCRAVIMGGQSRKASKFNITSVVEVDAENQPKAAVTLPDGTTAAAAPLITIEAEFPINERFAILEDYVHMVARSKKPSAMVVGSGGLGKSFTVMKVIKQQGLTNIGEWLERAEIGAKFEAGRMTAFQVVKGFSTAKGLYRTLYEAKNQLIIFDDCDSVLRDPVAANLLKAALDSYDRRVVTWASEGFIDDGLPRSFEFTGGVIFISNLPMSKIPQALRSRSSCVDVSMTRTEVVERMRVIVSSQDFMPEFDLDIKLDAMEFVAEHAFHPLVTDLNLRSLVNVIQAREDKPDTWRRMALYEMASASA